MIKTAITDTELDERTALSRKRLSSEFYDIDHVFAPPGAAWPGDKEGRALLAFVSLLNAGEPEIPCMEQMMKKLPSMLNEKGYLGEIKAEHFEQQLSGHSWLLRGLCEYYEKFKKSEVPGIINGIVENLYLPLTDVIADYPVGRDEKNDGGVDGHTALCRGGWLLSTDTCCAFMSIDGLSHVYKITKDERVLELLNRMIVTFMGIDKQKIKAQTHCTLTAARGMLRLYSVTHDESCLHSAEKLFRIYVDYALTYTYENYNWWGRPDTWTEPCAVIDSLMLAAELFKITGDAAYRTFAARIYHNGFASIQRCNGGAGTQKIVYENRDTLCISGFEAPQCCTMRLAEGLRYVKENRELLYAETSGLVTKDARGVYTDGDLVYAVTEGEEAKGLHPLVKYYKLTEEETYKLRQKIVFAR